MNILIINNHGGSEVRKSDFIPRIGEKVDYLDSVLSVTQVLNWPSLNRLKHIGADSLNIIAIVTVG